jgi:hypothetical protein
MQMLAKSSFIGGAVKGDDESLVLGIGHAFPLDPETGAEKSIDPIRVCNVDKSQIEPGSKVVLRQICGHWFVTGVVPPY